MENKIIVQEILVGETDIKYVYKVEGEIVKYFNLQEVFMIEYNRNIANMQQSIAVVPFLCNILPIIWLTNAKLYCSQIDKDFFEAIPHIKEGYEIMYPMLEFSGQIYSKDIIENSEGKTFNKTGAFFSGGVDAFTTLFRHIDEITALITVWGADIAFQDTAGWENVQKQVMDTCKSYGLETIIIKSNFREIVKENALNKLVEKSKDGWWHGFQSGMGLIGHMAPLVRQQSFKQLYIASSFSEEIKGQYTCASDPVIDNKLMFSGCRVIHDGYEYNRQKKVQFLCEYASKKNIRIPLRVCWESTGGENCCQCEKCCRTIMEIISEGYNPNDFGFIWEKKDIKRFRKKMFKEYRIAEMVFNALWMPILERLIKNKEKIKDIAEYQWLIDVKLKDINNSKRKWFTRKYWKKKASYIWRKIKE